MLTVTVDLYSGRPNPELTLEEGRARDILQQVAQDPRAAASPAAGPPALGYRGVLVEAPGTGLMEGLLPAGAVRLAAGDSADEALSKELALKLVEAAEPAGPPVDLKFFGTAEPAGRYKQFLLEQIERGVGTGAAPLGGGFLPDAKFQAPHKLAPCPHETLAYDPSYWNDPAHIRRNNCYAFASNRRTDTFPQPGRATGQIYQALSCADVAQAAISDGARRDGNCLPDAERPRLYVALVIWPGQDYHWYRLQDGDFWAHKPGGTPATDRDNSGQPINDPSNCDRGPYTDFCGYMLLPKSIQVA